jgi:LmbE family N-acetylglucosaminyl deacetylase
MHLNSIEAVGHQYRHIYLSPHYDDAVLSCGGTIALQRVTNQRPLVITIFGGPAPQGAPLSPFAAQVQRETGLGTTSEEAVRRRREEDAAACEQLGADTLWLDFPEAIYRDYDGDEVLFGGVNRADLSIEEQLAALLLELHSRSPLAAIYAPLGVGHHVDHQLTCSAADRLVQQQANVKFYEDFPYVATPGALDERKRELGLAMEDELVEVAHEIPARIEAMTRYSSQVPRLFGTEERMRQMVEGYSGSIRRHFPGMKIERYWHW